MRKLLIRLLLWLLGDEYMPIPREVKALLPTARLEWQEHADYDQSGEWKRHQVYSRLQKKYPESSKRDIALAIELAGRG